MLDILEYSYVGLLWWSVVLHNYFRIYMWYTLSYANHFGTVIYNICVNYAFAKHIVGFIHSSFCKFETTLLYVNFD